MPEQPAPAPKPAPAGGVSDESKMFGLVAYVLSFVTGIIVYLMKKEDSYARFHAMQSIITGVIIVVLSIVLGIVSAILGLIPIVGAVLDAAIWGIFSLGVFILWIFLMWKGYSGERYKLPLIGPQAEKMAGA